MYDLKLINKDIVATSTGDLEISDEKTEVARQWLSVRLKTLLGEWFLDITQGVDWLSILSQRNNKTLVDTVIQRVIVETEYIERIVNYRSTQQLGSHSYIVTFRAEVENGDIISFDDFGIG